MYVFVFMYIVYILFARLPCTVLPGTDISSKQAKRTKASYELLVFGEVVFQVYFQEIGLR